MKRRGIVYGFVVALGAVLLWALPLGVRAFAQQAPPLGALVREYEVVTMPSATAYSIYTTNRTTPHQVWYRISGGDALFRQRLRVYQENAGPRPINQLPPESELRQEITTNNPTRWFSLPRETDVFTYYFDGDNRLTVNSPWRDAFGVRVQRTRYANGNRYAIGFEDQETLDDYNDLELDVVIIQPA
ncbi:hypothetical protein [Leptolyngbya sp. KIOST-1]|uniref:hypothetical protein n=1 Tax=Leptolyngbya sp. KIOST-1 TaxID=1229172 RepID=UPI0005656FED|nr:hypothetical protein [Leptolyngbya sp. KIOST-1]